MNLNTDYRIPYLASNAYIYGGSSHPAAIPKPKEESECTFIASIKNPILCQQDPISSNHSSIEALPTFSTRILKYSEDNLSKPQVMQPNEANHERSPNVNYSENPIRKDVYPEKTLQVEYLNPSHRTFDEIYSPSPARELSNPSDLSYKTYSHKDPQFSIYDAKYSSAQEKHTENPAISLYSYNHDRSYEPSDQVYSVKSPSSYLSKFDKDHDRTFSLNPKKYSEDHNFENSVLAERDDSRRIAEENIRKYNSAKKYKKNEEFLEDVVKNYRNWDSKENLYEDHSEKMSRNSEYVYKEEFKVKKDSGMEQYDRYLRPTREIWMEQSKSTNKFTSAKPNLDISRLDKGSRSLSTKSKARVNVKLATNKAKADARSACSSKERSSREKESFVNMMMKVLKKHSKNCPALRREINAIRSNKSIL